MFSGVAKLGNICWGSNDLCPGSKNVFDLRQSEHVRSKRASNGGKGGCDHFALFSVDFKESESMIV